MTRTLLLAFALLLAIPVFAQNGAVSQPSQAFPFKITLTSPDGATKPSAQVLGQEKKPTVIAFWLTTCPPCLLELDAYTRNFSTWQQQAQFNMFAVSIDFPDRFPQVTQRARDKKYPFGVWWDRERLFKTILPGELNGLPQVFLFDKNGKLVWQHKGYATGDEKELFNQIKRVQ